MLFLWSFLKGTWSQSGHEPLRKRLIIVFRRNGARRVLKALLSVVEQARREAAVSRLPHHKKGILPEYAFFVVIFKRDLNTKWAWEKRLVLTSRFFSYIRFMPSYIVLRTVKRQIYCIEIQFFLLPAVCNAFYKTNRCSYNKGLEKKKCTCDDCT